MADVTSGAFAPHNSEEFRMPLAIRVLLFVTFVAVRPAAAVPVVLQVDAPWQTSGPNTGSVGTSAVSASSANDRWWSGGFIDENVPYADASIFGSLALAGATGDGFVLEFTEGRRTRSRSR
jgi:hypothetical protein